MYKNEIFQDLHGCYKEECFDSFLDKYIPKYVYKYYSLDCNDSELDSSKINSLINDKIWFSQYNQFNDPNEFKILQISDNEKSNWNDVCDWYFNIYKSIMKFTSFTSISPEYENMWKKYANDGKGYCCKYEINNNRLFMPTFYLKSNVNPMTTYIFYFNELQLANGDKNRCKIINEKYSYLLKIFASGKDNKWINEREYRAFICHITNTKSENIDLSYLGIKLITIFIGSKLPINYSKRLIKIANNKKCNCLILLDF